MFKIGDFARLGNVSIRLLRHYDDIGLLKPALVDRSSSYRYYSADQLPLLHRILALKDLGLALEEIKLLLDENLSSCELRGMLMFKQAELRQRIREEQRRLERIEERLKYIESGDQQVDILMKSTPAIRALSVKEFIPMNVSPSPFFREAYQAIKQQGVIPDRTMGIYHGGFGHYREYTRATGLRLIEAVYLVADPVQTGIPFKEDRQFEICDLPAFESVVTAIYKGPDWTRHLGFQALFAWIEMNGYRRLAPSREIYLHRDKNPENHLTEMQIPIEKLDP